MKSKNNLMISDVLLRLPINLSKPNEIYFFYIICYLKQKQMTSRENNNCTEFQNDDEYTKFSKDIVLSYFDDVYKNDKIFSSLICNLKNGVSFLGKDFIEIKIINEIYCDNKFVYIDFNEYEFDKFFMCNKNYTILALDKFRGIKSKNTIMILNYIFMLSEVRGCTYIMIDDLYWIFSKNKNDVLLKTITRDLKSAISQINNIMNDITNVEFSKKNDRFILSFKKFRVTFDIEVKEKKQIEKKNDTNVHIDYVSEEEIRLYGGYDE